MQHFQMSNYNDGSILSSLANQDEPHEGGRWTQVKHTHNIY